MVQLDCHQNNGTSGASFIPQIWVRSKQTNKQADKQTNKQTNKQNVCIYTVYVYIYIIIQCMCIYIIYGVYIYIHMYVSYLLYIFVKSKLEVSSGTSESFVPLQHVALLHGDVQPIAALV